MSALTGIADFVATRAHSGQTDKAGAPYIDHPRRVAAAVAHMGETHLVVGLRHDVVEDTSVTLDRIRQTFGEEIAEAVDSVTRRPGEMYMDFVRRTKTNAVGRAVKIADLLDNLNPERMAQLPSANQASMRKRYLAALAVLRTEDPTTA